MKYVGLFALGFAVTLGGVAAVVRWNRPLARRVIGTVGFAAGVRAAESSEAGPIIRELLPRIPAADREALATDVIGEGVLEGVGA